MNPMMIMIMTLTNDDTDEATDAAVCIDLATEKGNDDLLLILPLIMMMLIFY